MRIVSVNLGKAQTVEAAGGRTVRTAIFKSAVEGPVAVLGVQLKGDEQADLRVHGGPYKALYA